MQEKKMQRAESMRFRERKVRELMVDKKRLVEVPYTASLAHTMNALVANKVLSVPVAAPPGQWIGAGGSMIMEFDKQTGAVRKHYIGMVTMLDIVAHIAGDDDGGRLNGGDGREDLHQRMSVPVSSIIGHCFEGLSLWTLNPNTSVIESMEVLSKGVHRVLVPVESQMENEGPVGVELVESASSYRMLTQMDVLRFMKEHTQDYELENVLSLSLQQLGAINHDVYAITDRTKLIDAIKCLKTSMFNAVPIVTSSDDSHDHHLIHGRGRKLIGTFSATDLRGCYVATLKSWLGMSALAFTQEVGTSPLYSPNNAATWTRELVTCQADSPLSEVIEKAVSKHVHRVWVVDLDGRLLLGLVSLTDLIRVLRHSLASD
ncbi:hypothetical protein K1719_021538 [Acacia pycnantha]|nr:hypothetical protein K1719_021538 [Acacia pycnantha]